MSARDSSHLEYILDYGVDEKARRISLHGDIDEESVRIAIRAMMMFADTSATKPITLVVSSYGGNLDESFALHDVVKAVGCPVYTLSVGKCMSAAPLLVACGEPGARKATPHTSFMFHDAQLCYEDGDADSPSNILATAEQTMGMMDRYAGLLARYTAKRKDQWKRIFAAKVDRYFSAREALEWGIIDEIWEK